MSDFQHLSHKPTAKQLILIGIIFFSILLPRIFDLNRFVTVDEPEWLFQSANFYYALGQRDFEETFRRIHPGVTAMWAGTVGFLIEYPEHRGSGAGYLDTAKAEQYFKDIGQYNALLRILKTARAFIVVGAAITLSFAFYYAWRLFELLPALVGILLIAFEPYHVALNRVLHHDNTMSNMMFLSILALLAYFYRGRNNFSLVLSAFAGGVGFLAKAPGIFIFPFVGLFGLVLFYHARTKDKNLNIKTFTKPLIAWGLIAFAAIVLIWPAMWVAPIETLSKVFAGAINSAIEGHDHGPIYFYGNLIVGRESLKYVHFYPVTYLWHTTPVVLIGLVLAIFAFIKKWGLARKTEVRQFALIFVLFILTYFTFMSLGAKKIDRYFLPVYLPLNLLAGLGWIAGLQAAAQRFSTRLNKSVRSGILAVVIVMVMIVQAAGTIAAYPYYFNYYNPWLGGLEKASQVFAVGWGEGMDIAGRYLDSQQNPQDLIVISSIPYGNLTFYFKGETIKAFNFNQMTSDQANDLQRADYIIRYVIKPGGGWNFVEPEFVGQIDGVDYVAVYNIDDIPPEIIQGWLDNVQGP